MSERSSALSLLVGALAGAACMAAAIFVWRLTGSGSWDDLVSSEGGAIFLGIGAFIVLAGLGIFIGLPIAFAVRAFTKTPVARYVGTAVGYVTFMMVTMMLFSGGRAVAVWLAAAVAIYAAISIALSVAFWRRRRRRARPDFRTVFD